MDKGKISNFWFSLLWEFAGQEVGIRKARKGKTTGGQAKNGKASSLIQYFSLSFHTY
jgi:hypothetical protein